MTTKAENAQTKQPAAEQTSSSALHSRPSHGFPRLASKAFVEAWPSAFLAAERATDHESYGYAALSDVVDRSLHASVGHLTGGLSPAAMAGAYWDWAAHLASSPGKQMQLAEKAMRKTWRFANYAWRCSLQPHATPCIEPLPQDKRFSGEAWRRSPYALLYQGFLLNQQWWHNATTGIAGVTKQHENVVEFASRQLLDMFSPSNFLLTNPEALQRTLETGGVNLVVGGLVVVRLLRVLDEDRVLDRLVLADGLPVVEDVARELELGLLESRHGGLSQARRHGRA